MARIPEMLPAANNCLSAEGSGTPSGCKNCGFWETSAAPGTALSGSNGERNTKASASERFSRAELLKSGFAGSSTIRKSDGLQNFIRASLSIITWVALTNFSLSAGSEDCRCAAFDCNHSARCAPAAKNRELSEAPSLLTSSWMANRWSSSRHEQDEPLIGHPDSA